MSRSSRLPSVRKSVLTSTVRGWRGSIVRFRLRRPPAQMLVLYELEGDAACRRLREVLTELDLDVLIRPCPEGGDRFRRELPGGAAAAVLPTLFDPNAGDWITGADAVLSAITGRYGGPALSLPPTRLAELTTRLANRLREGRGLQVRASRAPAQPLELYSFESSPFSRPVREVLAELELPYVLRNTGKGRWTDYGPPSVRDRLWRAAAGTTPNRQRLLQMTGRVQVPYLIDPNSGYASFESRRIIRYLEERYAA